MATLRGNPSQSQIPYLSAAFWRSRHSAFGLLLLASFHTVVVQALTRKPFQHDSNSFGEPISSLSEIRGVKHAANTTGPTSPWHHPFIHSQQYGSSSRSNDLFYPSLEVGEIQIEGYNVVYASDPPRLLENLAFPDLQMVYVIQHGGWWTDIEILPSWGSTQPTSRVGYLGIIFMTEALCNEGSDPQGDRRCLRKPDGPCRKFVQKFKQCERYHMWSTVSPGPRHLWSTGGVSRTEEGDGVSSFAVMDEALRRLGSKTNFPGLTRVEMVAQCSGATYFYLYSLMTEVLSSLEEKLSLRLLLTNPSSFPWSGEDRPFHNSCAGNSLWPYGGNLHGMLEHYMLHRSIRAYPEVPTYIFSGTRDSTVNQAEPCARIAQGASRAERSRFFARHLLETSGDSALRRVTFVEEEASHDYMHMLMERRPFVSLLRDFSASHYWDVFSDYSCMEPSKVIKSSVPVKSWGDCQAMCDASSACKVATLWEGKSCSTYEYCTYGLARSTLKSFERQAMNLDRTCAGACKKHAIDGCVSFFVNVNPDKGTSECVLLQKRAGRHELAIRTDFHRHHSHSTR